MLVGNRAGVVEWTSEAFSLLTGFPLIETLDKPISHFLERAGLEIDLVDFVAQNFLEGRTCTVELPFETFDGRAIHVHLDVEPLRQDDGEITHFIAVASDVSDRSNKPSAPATRSASDQAPLAIDALANRSISRRVHSESTPLGELVSCAAQRFGALDPAEVVIELLCEPDLPNVDVDPLRMRSLLDCLFSAALADTDRQPVFVTASTGLLAPGRSHLSPAHPIPARSIPRATRSRVYLEIHDTSPHLAGDFARLIKEAGRGRNWREHLLCQAADLADRLGLSFYLNSTPGCGTQVLLLVPPDLI